MIVNVVFLQDPAPIVVEVDAHLFATVYPVPPEDGLTGSGDPHTSQSIGVDLIPLNDATPIIMLETKREWLIRKIEMQNSEVQ